MRVKVKGGVTRVLSFIGSIYAASFSDAVLEDRLTDLFGPVTMKSPESPFDESSYYEAEMGAGLRRRFFAFGGLVDPMTLLDVKRRCIGLEEEYSEGARRTLNLDPGYLDLHKVVLLSEKYSGRKIYLGQGIYADLTLLFEDGRYVPHDRAFPDFRDGRHDQFFMELRARYREAMRNEPRDTE